MSDEMTKLAEQQEKLFVTTYVPAFVKACAELGIPVNSEEELQAALETAAHVKQAAASQPESASQSIHIACNHLLKSAAGAPEPTPELDQAVAETVAALLQNDEVVKTAAEAIETAASLGGD